MRKFTTLVSFIFAWGLLLCWHPPARGGDGKEKPKPEITLTLHFPAETKVSATEKYVEKLKTMQGVKLFYREPEKGKGIYADVSATSLDSPKAVAAVVEELLRVGVLKISIEIRK